MPPRKSQTADRNGIQHHPVGDKQARMVLPAIACIEDGPHPFTFDGDRADDLSADFEQETVLQWGFPDCSRMAGSNSHPDTSFRLTQSTMSTRVSNECRSPGSLFLKAFLLAINL